MSVAGEQRDPLVDLVGNERIRSLLIGRSAKVLDDPDKQHLFDGLRDGTAAEVRSVIGPRPTPQVTDLAGWAVTVGTAAALEDALFPEQNPLGDAGRAQRLQVKYLGILAELRRLSPAGDVPGTPGSPGAYASGLVHMARGGR